MKTFLLLLCVALSSIAYGQANKSSTGNWSDASKWSGSNIGDAVTEVVTTSQNITSTILNGETYTTGNFSLQQNNKFYINVGGTLNVGDPSHPSSFTTDQNNELYIDGDLIVWGAMNIPQNIVIKIKGTLTVKGNLTMAQNANIQLDDGAKLIISGNFLANHNANVNINGAGQVLVSGNVNVNHGSNLNTPSGGFQYGGTCTDVGNNFCRHATANTTLPIKLLYFKSEDTGEQIRLYWATVSEENFSHFDVEKADESLVFNTISRVDGHGNSNTLQRYELLDNKVIGKAYYRLKSVDLDGTIDYSNVILISVDAEKEFNVFPNPATSSTGLTFVTNFNPESGDQIIIVDQLGQLKYSGDPASNKLTPDLSTGVYIVRYTSRTYQNTIKLIVK